MNRQQWENEFGIVSLLTTIVISILLTIIVTSAVGLSVGELHQAIDGDQSVKAYYAAEAGVEEALLSIANNPTSFATNNSCSAPVILDFVNNPNVAYTCKTIQTTINKLAGQLEVDQSGQIGPINGFDTLTLNWHQFGTDPDIGSPYVGPAGFPARLSWTYPAVMELTALGYNPASIKPSCSNKSNPPCAGGIAIESTIINPASGGGGGSIATKTLNGNCTTTNIITTGGFDCTASISGFNAAQTYVLRLRPRYTGGHYAVQFLNGGAAATIPAETAVIDVTARAGSVYRRVQAQVPIHSAAVSGLDYVLFSDGDICKDFQVKNNAAINGGCPLP